MTFPVVSADSDHRLLSLHPYRGAIMTNDFPVVSADSDHRLLSCNPFGVRSITQLHNLTGGESRGPGPLKVVATQLARHIHHFADKVEPGNAPGFHCL